jgi:hypothetical protein
MQVESSGRKLFFAFSPSRGGGDDSAAAATEVTLGLIKSRGEKEEDCCPVISVPKDQHGLRTLLFCNADSWIPEVVPFLGQLISTGHPLLLKAHNETGFMPRFSEITGRVYRKPAKRTLLHNVSMCRCTPIQIRPLLPSRAPTQLRV